MRSVQEDTVTTEPTDQANPPGNDGAQPPCGQGQRVRVGLVGTLIALQAVFAANSGASALSITRAGDIREKMARSDPAIPQSQAEAPSRLAQWRNWGNWGNWPGWLPRKARRWRWPRA